MAKAQKETKEEQKKEIGVVDPLLNEVLEKFEATKNELDRIKQEKDTLEATINKLKSEIADSSKSSVNLSEMVLDKLRYLASKDPNSLASIFPKISDRVKQFEKSKESWISGVQLIANDVISVLK
jgi:chromosome segregation ATPase